MICIYTHTISPRLQYICRLIFDEMMGVPHQLSIDSEHCRQFNGPVIDYSEGIIGNGFQVKPHGLLFEQDIRPITINCFVYRDLPAFLETGGDMGFDVLAAAFYLVSRYEEYLPYEKDEYERFPHKASLAYRNNFLKMPVVNAWVHFLAEGIQKKYPGFTPRFPDFHFLPTYDIDMAFSYRHKGWLRNAGGFLRSPSLERLQVLAGIRQDPFDSYQRLDELHRKYDIDPLYFFLVAERNAVYDKNILPHKEVMWKLVKRHAKKYAIGLHPSWQSGDAPALLEKEKKQLEAMSETPITRSRQHYLRFRLPEGYRSLINAGITEDHSMGYGSINGFRASVAHAYYWYDLDKEEATGLRIFPFCFMDANAFYEEGISAAEALDEMLHYLQVCRIYNGTLISLWHNNFLGTGAAFKGWYDAYEKFIAQARQ